MLEEYASILLITELTQRITTRYDPALNNWKKRRIIIIIMDSTNIAAKYLIIKSIVIVVVIAK